MILFIDRQCVIYKIIELDVSLVKYDGRNNPTKYAAWLSCLLRKKR